MNPYSFQFIQTFISDTTLYLSSPLVYVCMCMCLYLCCVCIIKIKGRKSMSIILLRIPCDGRRFTNVSDGVKYLLRVSGKTVKFPRVDSSEDSPCRVHLQICPN